MKTYISFVLIIFLSSSCAMHYGDFQSSTTLSHDNFMLKKLAVASASDDYFLGIGGLSTNALVLQAKRNLYQNYPLKKGQSFANISIDFENAFYFIYVKRTCTISADIVQFGNQSEETQYLFDTQKPMLSNNSVEQNNSPKNSSENSTNNENKESAVPFFNVGDTAIYLKWKDLHVGVIQAIENDINTFSSPTLYQGEQITLSSIFLFTDRKNYVSSNGTTFKPGDSVRMKKNNKFETVVIVAVNESHFLVRTTKGKLMSILQNELYY